MTNEIYVEDACLNKSIDDDICKLLNETVSATLKYENITIPCYVSITVVEEDEIKEINNEHRGIDSVTDVLSFPVVNLIDGSFDNSAGDYYEGRLILGDVVLCAKRAKEQSIEFGHSYDRELGYLTCHSILHLIGYDHEDDSEREVMRQKEEAVMAILNLKR
ncbi:MAG: rRNA maturation RNase YbeY [Clostridia bacterium]|nr:rRNA maturation RNase YbeY [Clostridia bacterium]